MFTRKDLIRLIIPLVVEQILAVTIGMADTVMVASVGEAAVSGVSLVDTINILLINIFTALATGGAVVASQYLGKGEQGNACIAAKQLLLSITALSFGISVLSVAGRLPILNLVFGNIEPEVMSNAQTYFLLTALSYPFLGIYNAGAALFRAMGNSKVSMFISMVMNLINIVGNAILIYGLHIGVAGAGTATLVSRIVGAVIVTVLMCHHSNPIHYDSLLRWKFHPAMVKSILHIGVPNGLENGMFQVGKVLVQGLIASFGTTAIAANAVANSIASVEVIPGSAMGLALITVVGQCVGAGEYDQAKRYTILLMKITYLSVGLLNLAILPLIGGITAVFQLSSETASIAIQLMWIHGVCAMVIWPASFTLPNALRAANDVRYPMMISIFSMWTFRIGCSYLLGQVWGMGVVGVWLAMIIDWIFRASLFILRFCRGKWRGRQLV